MSKPATGLGPPSKSRQILPVKVVKTTEAPGPSRQWPVKMAAAARPHPLNRLQPPSILYISRGLP